MDTPTKENEMTTTRKQDAEIVALTDDQWGRYDEAKRCGATHDDAMDAAHTGPAPRKAKADAEIDAIADSIISGEVSFVDAVKGLLR